ncbi:angiopoietin-related protein 7-like [Haliotis rubra]|uniref:angiopoietin-related protein 7-like n=1 Tax=Haliotis rubra TaxID=36100 RepID=UPI001EE62752|nr:angiopoietin-related protein 7-like [Haliotis rubra]
MLDCLRSLFVMLVTCVFVLVSIGGSAVSAIFDKNGCAYTFSVWHPDEDILRQVKDLQVQFSNFTNYAEAQVSRIQRNVIHEMRKYDNSTSHLESELLQMKLDDMQAKMKHNHLSAEVNIMRRDMEDINRKVDDLEMDYFSLKARGREPRNDSVRKGHRSMSKDFIGMMKNSVGDLKAEWLLMKREMDDIRGENLQLKHGQNNLKNDTSSLRQVMRSLSGEIQAVEGRDWRVPQSSQQVQSEMSGLKRDLKRIKDEQSDIKSESTEMRNEIATLHTSNIRVLKDLHELQLDGTRFREKLESLRREERRGGETEVTRERLESNLPSTDDVVPRDCHEIYQSGYRTNGLYKIHAKGARLMTAVYCEMVNKTGYLVLQRRIDGLLNFNRRWLEYKHGFGNPYGEFYIGNELLHLLTKQKQYILRVDMWDWEGNKAYAEYNVFAVEGEANHYRLHVNGYRGDAGDSLNLHDNMAFSTEDVDNDLHARHCAAENKGGWWFNSCYSSNLNGVFHTAWYSQSRSKYADGVVWYTWKGSEFYSLKQTEMKIRPKVP